MAEKLGRGDYEGAGPFALSREEGRDLFLTRVVPRYPDVLTSLWHEAHVIALVTSDFSNISGNWSRVAVEERQRRRKALKECITAWARSWKLDAPWVLARADQAVREWVTYPDSFPPPPWDAKQIELVAFWLVSSPTSAYGVGAESITKFVQSERGEVLEMHTQVHETRFLFAHRGWHPTLIRRVDYENGIRTDFETKLAEYLAAREKLAEAEGWRRPTTEKRERDHFDWLARYQVGGEDFRAIAAAVQRDRSSVTEAIRDTADLIGLDVRLARRGHPPKKSKAG